MTSQADIKTVDLDEKSLYRTQRIKVSSSKTLLTPTKTIPLDKIKLIHPLNKQALQLNEMFKRLNAEQIKQANEDNDSFSRLEKDLNAQKAKIADGTITLCFIDFNEQRIPSAEEIEFMTEIAYPHTDLTCIPTINHANQAGSSINYVDFKKYAERAIETIEQLNHKPIMGLIPKLAPKKISDLIQFYHGKGINSFAMDFGGGNPISQATRLFKVQKELNKLKILEESYIHGHNINVRVQKAKDVIPAKDILGFGVGLSSLGEKRTVFRPNPAFISMIQTNPLNKFRLFNKKDYGYWKGITAEDLTKVFPKDCNLPLQVFSNPSQMGYVQRVFNAEQLALESHHIRDIVHEDSSKSLSYVRSKKHVTQDDMALLEKAQKKIK
ncbi:hypothetical protein JXA85_08895 [Candidatus Woesearchaeota archaeon]|nr:hypothetical protein [Candidatus Woesearchaeota archaeon]